MSFVLNIDLPVCFVIKADNNCISKEKFIQMLLFSVISEKKIIISLNSPVFEKYLSILEYSQVFCFQKCLSLFVHDCTLYNYSYIVRKSLFSLRSTLCINQVPFFEEIKKRLLLVVFTISSHSFFWRIFKLARKRSCFRNGIILRLLENSWNFIHTTHLQTSLNF